MKNNEIKYGYILGSVDLCNSTVIKSRFEDQEPEYKNELYEAYLHDLYANEITFYNNLVKSYKFFSNSNENLLSSLYVLKNIGDEFWFRIKVDLNDTNKIANIMMALYSAFEAIRSGWITIRKSDPKKSWQSFEAPDFISFNYKTYFDLVDYAIDCSEIRYDFFKKNINQIIGRPTGNTNPEELNDLFKRLNVGNSFETPNNENHLHIDMIGYQIDNFFRHAKFAVNHMFAVGERLYGYLGNLSEKNMLTVTAGNPGLSCFNYFYWISKIFMPKGISNKYNVYYLIEEQAFEVLKLQIISFIQDNKDNIQDLKGVIDILNEIIHKYRLKSTAPNILDDFSIL